MIFQPTTTIDFIRLLKWNTLIDDQSFDQFAHTFEMKKKRIRLCRSIRICILNMILIWWIPIRFSFLLDWRQKFISHIDNTDDNDDDQRVHTANKNRFVQLFFLEKKSLIDRYFLHLIDRSTERMSKWTEDEQEKRNKQIDDWWSSYLLRRRKFIESISFCTNWSCVYWFRFNKKKKEKKRK